MTTQLGDPRDVTDSAYRHEPYDIEVEQALLGAFLVDSNSYWRVVEILKPDHFYDQLHARIYETIGTLCSRDQRVTPLSLHAALKADPGLIELEGMRYLAGLAAAAPSLPNVKEYAGILRGLAVRRAIIRAGQTAVAEAYEPPLDRTPDQIADKAAEQLFEASQGAAASEGAVTIRELAARAAQSAENAMNTPASVCLSAGLRGVDAALGGLYRGDLTILGGAPNMGKTSLLQHILFANAAAPKAEEALFFSLEMMAEQVATRELAMRARVPSDLMRRGKITMQEAEKLALAAHQFPDLPYKIDGTRRLSVAQMRARTQALKRRSRRGVSLVGIDHLRFIKPARPRDDEKDQIQQITSDLKDMATELNVAVVIVSHLNRDFSKRVTARPQLTDLYGSAAIEQNADAVWFIHRPSYYLERNPPAQSANGEEKAKWAALVANAEGKAEIFAAKQRMGPIGSATVLFEEKFTQFSDAPGDDTPAPTQEELSLYSQLRG